MFKDFIVFKACFQKLNISFWNDIKIFKVFHYEIVFQK